MSKKLSVIVPYRNRQEHLEKFIPHMENFLNNAGIMYNIIVVEQDNPPEGQPQPFNRAKLLNVGFDLTKDTSSYFCFHDVDMLPVHADYSYVNAPTHMATECSQFGYQLPYSGYFGGVTIFNKQDFLEVNGYSNDYWGWGAEDDDMMVRCYAKGKLIPPLSVPRRRGRYESLSHDRRIVLEDYKNNILKLRGLTEQNICNEGISTLTYQENDRCSIPNSMYSIIVRVSI